MGTHYSFEDMPAMASFFENLAKCKREQAKSAITTKDRYNAIGRAVELEYVVSVIRSSNLFEARFLPLGVIWNLEDVVDELNDTAVILIRRAKEFQEFQELQEKGGSGIPSTYPTFEGDDADAD